jgi:hypothetical protein
MKFGGNRGQLDDAQKTARARWESVCDVWNDAARQEHESTVVVPLDTHVSEVLRAVDQLMTVFATARRECEFDPN